MIRSRSRVLGFVLRVVVGTACGVAVGATLGLLLTAVNNLILARRFGAAEASYEFWAVFLGKLLLLPSVGASTFWGITFLRSRSSSRGHHDLSGKMLRTIRNGGT